MYKAVNILDLNKKYALGNETIHALQKINLEIEKRELVVIVGPSGSGKTTLLNIIGGIDKPTSGKVEVFGEELSIKDEDALADFRCNKIGFVFQSYNLVSTLTVAENIAFPMEWTGKSTEQISHRTLELLEALGLTHRTNYFSAQLSGGEQQRVAFARALANNPPLLLADEPTGNLDSKNSQRIVQLLQKLKANGKTIIVSTHDSQIIAIADKIIFLENGKLVKGND